MSSKIPRCNCSDCRNDPTGATATLHAQMKLFASTLNEKQRRLFAGLEANRRGRGGQKKVAEILGLSTPTVRRGQRELAQGDITPGIRRPGGGRKPVKKEPPGVAEDKKTVVCIEDEPDMIDLIRLILEHEGFKLIGALGGHEGLDTIRQVKPDLVLLDLMMPRMDGWEVYQWMKDDDELRSIPIIVVTVLERDIDRVRGLQVDDYVMKPFLPRELVRRVRNVLGLVVQPDGNGSVPRPGRWDSSETFKVR